MLMTHGALSELRIDCVYSVAENCIVVAEGVLQHSGTFKVRALGFPPVELRGESRAAAKVGTVSSVPISRPLACPAFRQATICDLALAELRGSRYDAPLPALHHN